MRTDHDRPVTGGDALLGALHVAGIDLLLTNPGTSEMHAVAALDRHPQIRAVLTLFEGVATGAADGYARMSDQPAATLLHLGAGLANGLANLHNARRAHSPVVNLVGDHAGHHLPFDAPLTSDIEAAASTVSVWTGRVASAAEVGNMTVLAARTATTLRGVSTLILPADAMWSTVPETSLRLAADTETDRVPDPGPDPEAVCFAAERLRAADRPVILLGGGALRADAIRIATAIADATGATLWGETFPARHERGGSIPTVPRLPYLAEMTEAILEGTDCLVIVGAAIPVSFFAYQGRRSTVVPESTDVHHLCGGSDPAQEWLQALAAALELTVEARKGRPLRRTPVAPEGPIDATSLANAIGAWLPEGTIVVDEANTSGIGLAPATEDAPQHDWLNLTGGAIGMGMPLATGTALACPDRRTVNIEADGSAMYTLQALWTQARESLPVTTVICNNGAYAILDFELSRMGAGGGPSARRLFDLREPAIDFLALAAGMGVPGRSVDRAEELSQALRDAAASDGPFLIDARMAPPPLRSAT